VDLALAIERLRVDPRDRAAAAVVAERAAALAMATASAVLVEREAAADVAQEATLRVLQRMRQLDAPWRFDGWVHRIAVHAALDALRRRRRRGERPLETDAIEPTAPGITEPAARLEAQAASAAIETALRRLPDRQRVALVLRYVHDLTEEEVADALGVRLGTATSLLSRARAALRADPDVLALRPGASIEALP
jgi:RNA polymerase sigma-70 factor (ECF subfamily)